MTLCFTSEHLQFSLSPEQKTAHTKSKYITTLLYLHHLRFSLLIFIISDENLNL